MSRSYSTHHKEAYADTWEDSNAKEERFARLFAERTGLELEATGFGAMSSGYIKGSSGSHGYEKAAPDFTLPGTPIRIEVTGPLRGIGLGDDLLVNTSKVLYARDHPELEYWVAHINGIRPNAAIRMIRVGQLFWAEVGTGRILQEFQTHRGVSFRGFAVPFDSRTICTFDRFASYAKSLATSHAA